MAHGEGERSELTEKNNGFQPSKEDERGKFRSSFLLTQPKSSTAIVICSHEGLVRLVELRERLALALAASCPPVLAAVGESILFAVGDVNP